jgi:hypothetical protein
MSKMKLQRMPLLLAAASLVACSESPMAPGGFSAVPEGFEAITEVTTQNVGFGGSIWVSCANGGAGESVSLSGELRMKTQTFESKKTGEVLVRLQSQPSDVDGVGSVTGASYHGAGVAIEAEHRSPSSEAYNYHFIHNFLIIGQGPGNNILVHTNVHQTLNANGEAVSSVNLDKAECQ